MNDKSIKWSELSRPITPRWKFQNKLGTDKCICVAYNDARDIQNRLDQFLTPSGWQCEHYAVAAKVFCRLSIYVNGVWISKTDTGSETKIEGDKGAASTALRRAASAWGIARNNYDTQSVILAMKNYKGKDYPSTDEGKLLWNNDALTEYINKNFDKLQKI